MAASADSFDKRFGGIERLYGQAATDRLRRAHVCVLGVGGVGSWTVEALARSGIGTLTLIDLDDVCISNTNRQLHAMDGEVGRPKIDVLRDRVGRINPECQVRPVFDFFSESSADRLLDVSYDFVVDAIDQAKNKVLLILKCQQLGLPLVVVGGAGGKRDPTAIKVDDLTRASNDGLLKRVRKQLRQKHGFPRDIRQLWDIPCVYSMENSVYPSEDGTVCERSEHDTSLRLDCASGFGAATFVTGTFGFQAAAIVVNRLTGVIE